MLDNSAMQIDIDWAKPLGLGMYGNNKVLISGNVMTGPGLE